VRNSPDLKERLVRAVADGQPLREAARRFGVAVTTVKRAMVQQRETGSLARKPIPGCPRRIRKDQEARLEAAPEATVEEHCAWWREQQGQELSVTGSSAIRVNWLRSGRRATNQLAQVERIDEFGGLAVGRLDTYVDSRTNSVDKLNMMRKLCSTIWRH
jgi:transposase